MHNKILIAIDGSIHSKNATAYAADLFKNNTKVTFTLINIQPIISQYLLDEARCDAEAYAELHKVMDKNKIESENLLITEKALLVQLGVDEQRIELISRPRMLGQVKDILEYAYRHRFDTLVIGRRGLTRLQTMFMGSTSAKIMEHAATLPIWIVDGKVTLDKALIALDASETSMRIIDYLAQMLSGNTQARLCFFHVQLDAKDAHYSNAEMNPSLFNLIERTEKNWREQFWPMAARRLQAAGIGDSQIKLINIKQKGRISKAIMEQIEAANYDTVVIGRSGSGNSFYFGRVARYIAERVTDRALWLVG